MLKHFALGQGNDVEDGFVKVEPILPWGRLFDEGADAGDDVAGSSCIVDNAAEGLPNLV
jgi:hypothetical protein